MAERIMGYDSNKDGKVSKEELPERMQRIMDRLDSNKDGFLTKDELSQAAPPPAPVNRLQGAPGRERVPSRPQ